MAFRHRAHPRFRWTLGTLGTLAAVAAVSAGAAPATSAAPLPDDNAGTGQYIEPVPDAGGDRPSATGSGTGGHALPPRTRQALPSGGEGRTLEKLATDPGSGAPAGGSADTAGSGGSPAHGR